MRQLSSLLGSNSKILLVGLSIMIVSAGGVLGYSYLSTSSHVQDQSIVLPDVKHIILFVGGMNSEIVSNHCEVRGDDSTLSFGHLVDLLNNLPIASPSAPSCVPTQSMDKSPINLAYFSYRGFAYNKLEKIPDQVIPYTACDADMTPLNADVSTFVSTLTAYRTFYPNVHFTIVAHSLGGLVALEGASDYLAHNKTSNIIDKLITIDSPLNGIPVNMNVGTLADQCLFAGGEVIQYLFDLHTKSPQESEEEVSFLKAQGTAVYTLGNDADCLYENVMWCTPDFLKELGVKSLLQATQTQFVSGAFEHSYHLPGRQDEKPPTGHGTILSNPSASSDIIRYIFAPIVTVNEPKEGETFWFDKTGTAVPFSARVRCLWGAANRADALIKPEDTNTLFAGTAIATKASDLLNLDGMVNLPSEVIGATANLYIRAGGNACQYPGIDPKLLPTNTDYLDGGLQSINFSLDGGKLVLGMNGRLYAGRPIGDNITNKPLDYSANNPITSDSFVMPNNAIQAVAWSPDGKKVAYLVAVGKAGDQDGITNHIFSSLYVASSALTEPQKLTGNLLDAVALTWNQSNDKIAILEEVNSTQLATSGFGPDLPFFKPAIQIVNASNGSEEKQIKLPATSTFYPICEDLCNVSRSRIQWGTNGAFLIGNGEVGGTFVSPSGEASQLETTSSQLLPYQASLGALNAQGTLVAYPTVNSSNGNSNVILYQVDPSTGSLNNPTVLGQFVRGYQATVDFSPDGSKIGLCAEEGVFIIDTHQVGAMTKVLDLPGAPQFWCENLRWDPNGQSILIQLGGRLLISQFGSIVGQAIVSLNDAPPQLLFGCGISATPTGLQYSGVYDPNCTDGNAVFEWQPIVQNQNNSPLPSLSNPNDNSKLLAQGGGLSLNTQMNTSSLSVKAGQTFVVYFDYENAGNTTWADTNGYQLVCDQHYMPNSNCMSDETQGFNGVQVPPGYQGTFYLLLIAPTSPGTYDTSWDMADKNGKIFGQNHVFVTVTVSLP